MAKLYSKNSQKKVKYLNPKKETVQFLLNYSKSLKVTRFKGMQFEAIMN